MKKILLLFLFLVGCTSGPYIATNVDVGNRSTFSTVLTDSETKHTVLKGFNQRVYIQKLDGKNLFRASMESDYPSIAYVKPGEHEVHVLYEHVNLIAHGCLIFKSEPARSYIIRHATEKYFVRFWVEDLESKEIIGKLCGFSG